MSSTLDYSSLLATVSALEAQLAALKSQIGAGNKTSEGAAKAAGKPKKERKTREGPPNAWVIFANRVRTLLGANGYPKNALGVECVQFASVLKGENADLSSWADADILARRAAWTAPPKKSAASDASAAASVVSVGDKPSVAEDKPSVAEDKPKKERKNPWAGLSEEAKAAKVKKMADARAAKKVSVTVAEVPPLPASPPLSVATDPGNFRKATVRGSAYLVNLTTGHAYARLADGSQGEWAGIFHRAGFPTDNGPFIDDSVAEPESSDIEELIF